MAAVVKSHSSPIISQKDHHIGLGEQSGTYNEEECG